jgi:hypothetical protein
LLTDEHALLGERAEGEPRLINSLVESKGKLRTLLSGKNSKAVRLSADEGILDFDEPVYIRRIEIVFESEKVAEDVTARLLDGAGNEDILPGIKQSLPEGVNSGTKVVFLAKRFLTKVDLRRAGSSPITGVRSLKVFGFALSAFNDLGSLLSDYVDLRYKINSHQSALKDEAAAAVAELEEARKNKKLIQESIDGLISTRKRVNSELSKLHATAWKRTH